MKDCKKRRRKMVMIMMKMIHEELNRKKILFIEKN